ncbi:hypothetical protein [Halonotius sp. GCM10025705]|uniref:hypothetical protein n=1 Tax=Halonotius sp. GCM10025705 TaxID=3252678 RepID=UPI0036118507
MEPTEWPLLNAVLDAGTDDPVFQGLLIAGPLVIGLIVLLGRSPVMTVLTGGYLAVVVANTLRNVVQWR